MKRRPEQKRVEKQIARERISHLFGEAEKIFAEQPERANRYVGLARKISMRYKVRIAPDLKRRFCKHCYVFLKPGENSRVRMREGKVIYYCFNCKKYMRFPVRKRV